MCDGEPHPAWAENTHSRIPASLVCSQAIWKSGLLFSVEISPAGIDENIGSRNPQHLDAGALDSCERGLTRV